MAPGQICSSCGLSFPSNHFVSLHGCSCIHCALCRKTHPAPLLSVATPAPNFGKATQQAQQPSPPSSGCWLSPAPPTSAQGPASKAGLMDTSAHTHLDDQADLISQLAESVTQIHQLILALCQDLAPPPVVSAPVSGLPPPALPPGESQLQQLFPWVSHEVAQKVYDNCLPPQDLGKLHNPAKLPAPAKAEPGLLVNSICISIPEASASGMVSRAFLCLLPDVCSFTQAWMVYTALCCTSTNDPHLSASLGAFLIHVIDLDVMLFWPAITEYVVAICQHHFGFASTGDWAEKDLNTWQEELGGAS